MHQRDRGASSRDKISVSTAFQCTTRQTPLTARATVCFRLDVRLVRSRASGSSPAHAQLARRATSTNGQQHPPRPPRAGHRRSYIVASASSPVRRTARSPVFWRGKLRGAARQSDRRRPKPPSPRRLRLQARAGPLGRRPDHQQIQASFFRRCAQRNWQISTSWR
jgi:hypothetical protein